MSRRRTLVIAILVVVAVGCAKMKPQDGCCGPFDASVGHDEIDAAARLQYESSRTETLGRLASRRRLGAEEQAHLVCAAVDSLEYESSRQIVLQQLIDNPDFTPDAKTCILHRLDTFDTDAARIRMLRALEGRGDRMPDLLPDGRSTGPSPFGPSPSAPSPSTRPGPP